MRGVCCGDFGRYGVSQGKIPWQILWEANLIESCLHKLTEKPADAALSGANPDDFSLPKSKFFKNIKTR
jgi:hypothetical protein